MLGREKQPQIAERPFTAFQLVVGWRNALDGDVGGMDICIHQQLLWISQNPADGDPWRNPCECDAGYGNGTQIVEVLNVDRVLGIGEAAESDPIYVGGERGVSGNKHVDPDVELATLMLYGRRHVELSSRGPTRRSVAIRTCNQVRILNILLNNVCLGRNVQGCSRSLDRFRGES